MRWFGVVSIFVLPSNQFYPPKKTDKQNQPKMIPLQKFFINPLSSHPPGIRRVPFFRCSPWRFASPPASTPQPPGPIGSQGCGGRQSKKPRGWIPSSQGKRSLVSMARWIGKPWHKPIKPLTRVGKMLTSLNVLVFFGYGGLENSGKTQHVEVALFASLTSKAAGWSWSKGHFLSKSFPMVAPSNNPVLFR